MTALTPYPAPLDRLSTDFAAGVRVRPKALSDEKATPC